ncbi:VWA containing CoxE family protein [Acinetobacter larvae]|uniref:VWA containing CoxE family protein n=2 Tax=Acinetobacter larvae TaxID=1789224 RepID=A0A1B2M3S2_9GAMM|nr:VWA containing CoxE family protein [Acinetobacter larvae]
MNTKEVEQNTTTALDPIDQARRWRLMLGRYADQRLCDATLNASQLKMEKHLDYLYRQEYQRRGIQQQSARHGSLDASQLTAIHWLNQSRKLFPKSTFERMQRHAIERYQMTELLKTPEHIQQLDANPAVAKALLSLRGRLNSEMKQAIRELIAKVVADLLQQIRPKFLQSLQGRRHRFRRSPIRQAQNFDWRRTIQENLKHYQVDRKQLIIQNPYFNARVQKHLQWDIVLCVDQSGSMMDSIMYAAICASILAALPAVNISLLLFDTQVVDLSHMAHDPVEVLLTIQLGGGTNIGQAMQYCAQKINNPQRSIVVLISDFEEGASIQTLLNTTTALKQQGCTLLGLAALDQAANPCYDHNIAQQLQQCGMQIAAMTPEHLATWFAEVMQ